MRVVLLDVIVPVRDTGELDDESVGVAVLQPASVQWVWIEIDQVRGVWSERGS